MIAMLGNHLWQSTLFALGVALVIAVLRHDAARIRYSLWLAASLKFLVPFSLLAAVGARLAPPYDVPISAIFVLPVPLERLAEPVAAGFPPALSAALLALWISGTAAVVARSMLHARRLRALMRDAAEPAAPVTISRGRLPIRYSNARIEPALVGIRRPVLLLPRDVEARLSPGQLEAVIAHERYHWERRDNLTGALHMLVEALFWFHPLVWWIGVRLVCERERACDEAVVEAGYDRRAYAEAILNVAELRVASPLKCAAGVGGIELKGRLEAVMMRSRAMKRLGIRKKLLLNFGAMAAVAVPVAGGWLTAGNSALAQQEEFLPIVKIAPVYPVEAAEIGLEGYVIVEFTVTETGSVDDLFVVESSSPIFEQAAIDAALKFKYQPRTINGSPVAVPGVRNKIVFVLEQDGQDDLVLREKRSSARLARG